MTYQKSSIVRATDFDGFLTTTNNVYGVGNSDRGYGQTAISQAAVSIGDPIRALHWANLRSMIVVAGQQQGTNVTSLPPSGAFVIGQPVIAFEQASPSSSPYEMANNITAIDTNRLTASNTSMSVTTGVETVTRATSWSGTITAEISVLWPSEDAARYFFNSAGEIRLRGAQPGSTPQDARWQTSFSTGLGTVKFKAHNTSNTGSFSGAVNKGFYEMTDSYQVVFNAASSGGGSYYTIDNITISAKRLTYTGVHGGNGLGIQFKIVLQDTGSYYYSVVTSAGTNFTFDNVRATTYLAGILAPTYGIVTNF